MHEVSRSGHYPASRLADGNCQLLVGYTPPPIPRAQLAAAVGIKINHYQSLNDFGVLVPDSIRVGKLSEPLISLAAAATETAPAGNSQDVVFVNEGR